MKVTKFEHACLVLDNDTSRLIIDPGSFTNLPDDLSNVSCVVCTEEHMDHYSLENIQKILQKSPRAKILSTESVARQLDASDISCEPMKGEQQVSVGGFTLRLREGDHAIVYGKSPCRVLTLRVDDFLYYPSDSFILTNANIQVLALPTSGPWHKISESVDFANKVKSKQIIVSHNGLYNDIGNTVTNNFTSNNILAKEREYIFLKAGESKEF